MLLEITLKTYLSFRFFGFFGFERNDETWILNNKYSLFLYILTAPPKRTVFFNTIERVFVIGNKKRMCEDCWNFSSKFFVLQRNLSPPQRLMYCDAILFYFCLASCLFLFSRAHFRRRAKGSEEAEKQRKGKGGRM